ncbi:DNA polymerase kappa-like isoform X2 [Asterias rubens]|nr:DNA polymerase kappa-like isoform X2 [Asterias rubens]XP_033634722.1 DNA polymerase kappa-like isoform X2 [Asterias rubens]
MNCQSATLEVGRRMKWQFGQDEEMANEIDDEGSGWAERFDDGEVWTDASRSVFQTEDEEANRNSDVSCDQTSSNMSRIALNDNKAGMDGLNKEKINKIIIETSKGSRFYENERKKEAQVNQRIERMKQQLDGISEQQKSIALAQVDMMVAELESSRSFNRSIIHLDMDAFYAAVEMRDKPSLKNKPMAVGSMSMLCTSNYHARRYGVRAAMPGFIAKKLCPELIITPTNFDKYRAVSKQVREILGIYDPYFCPVSLDEAYFDLTDHLEKRKVMSEDERTFEYGDWNTVVKGFDNDGIVEGVHVKKDDRGHEKSDSTRQDTRNGTELASDNDHVAKETPPLSTLKSNLDFPEKTLSQTKLMMSNKGTRDDMDIKSSFKDDNHSGTSHLFSPEVALDNRDHSTAMLSKCTVHEDILKEMRSISSKPRRCRTFGLTVEEVVEEIRFRIEQETQLTASAGIAPNTMLAKICSDKNKPNGQYRILPNRDAVMEFVQELPIRKVSGIGKVTEKLLSSLGIHTCTDLFQQRALLQLLFSPTSSQHFLGISLGLGSTRVERDGERKSMSTERTFRELHQPADLYNKCNELCQALAEDLLKEELMGKTVTIKLKTVKFEVKTKSYSVPSYIQTADCIFRVAKDLLKAEINDCKSEPLRLRLMGVRISNLQACGAPSSNKQESITKFFKKRQETTTPKQQPDMQPKTVDNDRLGTNELLNKTVLGVMSGQTQTTEWNNKSHFPIKSESKLTSSVSSTESKLGITFHDTFLKPSHLTGKQITNNTGGSGLLKISGEENLSLVGDQLVQSSEFICPVCSIQQSCPDLKDFSEHVDMCLNRDAIQDMLRQQASQDRPSSSCEAPSPMKVKRSSSGPKSAAKRRKQEKTQTNTLDKFFS